MDNVKQGTFLQIGNKRKICHMLQNLDIVWEEEKQSQGLNTLTAASMPLLWFSYGILERLNWSLFTEETPQALGNCPFDG